MLSRFPYLTINTVSIILTLFHRYLFTFSQKKNSTQTMRALRHCNIVLVQCTSIIILVMDSSCAYNNKYKGT